MRLYELAQTYQQLADLEDADAFEAALAELEGAIEDKARNIAALVRTLEGEAAAFERLKARQDTRLRKVERLKDYLKTGMETAGLSLVKAGLFTVVVQANPPSVRVAEGAVERLPAQFLRFVPARWEPDSKALLDYHRSGRLLDVLCGCGAVINTLPGVSIQRGTHLRIR